MKKYKVAPGDTLAKIADKFYGDPMKYTEIANANHLSNPNNISVGQELDLPGLEDENPGLKVNAGQVLSATQMKTIVPGIDEARISRYLNAINSELPKNDISTPLRAAHFIAQVAHESGGFRYNKENLNYSAQALRSVFGKYFKTNEDAKNFARQPEKIANRVYANRIGNGDEQSGEGWKYRGRGLIQLTGKENYSKCGADLNLDLLNNPDLVSDDPDISLAAACWYWNSRNLNKYADQDDVVEVTRRINGGTKGLDDRKAYLGRAKQILSA